MRCTEDSFEELYPGKRNFESITCELQQAIIVLNDSGLTLIMAFPLLALPSFTALVEALCITCGSSAIVDRCIELFDVVELVNTTLGDSQGRFREYILSYTFRRCIEYSGTNSSRNYSDYVMCFGIITAEESPLSVEEAALIELVVSL